MTKDILILISNILKELGCEGILITDYKGEVIYIEEEFFSEIWGLSANDLIGESVFDLEGSGVIKPALAIKVMGTQKPVRLISAVKGIYNVVGEAFPVMDINDEIKIIVTFTRNVISERMILQLYDEMLEKNCKHTIDNIDMDKWIEQEGMYTLNEQYAEVLNRIKKVARYDVPILLTGDTGTGKTMLAKKIHKLSGLKGEFVELNCGSISETLIESELYGYEKGAFTGADKGGKKGLVEISENGTLFLDEISEMPLHLQVKILHFLQNKKIRRVGGTKEIDVNCRVISATNKNLQDEVKAGHFREDLLYRLNLASFHIPALSNRLEDIVPLANSILKFFSIKYGKDYVFNYDVISLFNKYPWPGNIRELENTIHQLVLMTDSNVIRSDVLPRRFINASKVTNDVEYIAQDVNISYDNMDLKTILENVEGAIIRNAWKKYNSSTKIAKVLNIGQTTAARKIRKYVKEV